MTFRRILWTLGWPARAVLTGLLLGYRRLFGGAYGGRCRFHPSCSTYGLEAIRVHGATKGSILTIWRVLRCSPLSKGGFEAVPERGAWTSASMTTSHSEAGAGRVG